MTTPRKASKDKGKGKDSPPPSQTQGQQQQPQQGGQPPPAQAQAQDKPAEPDKEKEKGQDGDKKSKKSKKGSNKGLAAKLAKLPVWVKAGAAAVAGLGTFFILYKLMCGGSCPKRKQSYVCSRKTVEAIRCYPVVVPVEEEEE